MYRLSMQWGGMDEDRVEAELARMETIATLDRQRVLITEYRKRLAKAWRDVSEARYKLGRLGEKLEVKE